VGAVPSDRAHPISPEAPDLNEEKAMTTVARPTEHQRETLTTAEQPRDTRQRRKSHIAGTSKVGAAGFILPGYFFYAGFLLIPLVLTILLSFTNWNGIGYNTIQGNGVKNYVKLVNDPVFLQALVHNGVFLATTVILKVVLAFALALAVRRAFPGGGFFRAVFVIPSILSLIVVSLLLKFLVDPNNGLINPLLRSIGLGAFAGSWLGDPSRALPVLIGLDVWLGFGLFLFVFLAGMSALPADVSEAAKVDGAKPWQETWFVTIPLLAPTFRLVVLLGCIESLKVFATVYVATSGGPNHSTEVLATWAFFQAFTGNQVGYGSAIMSVLLVATLILAVFYVRANQKGNIQ
jgi:raffinose/stachyose/melibiose transport system permease protein